MNPFRKVTKTKDCPNPGFEKHWAVGGSRLCTLECGHEWPIKMSRKVPERMRCRDCGMLMSGAPRTSFNVRSRTAEVETWNAETQMPVRTKRPMTSAEVVFWSRGRSK